MNLIDWSPELELGEETMDATHREFVERIIAVGAAPDEQLLPALDAFLEHTEAHFGDENRRMAEVNFPPSHCHTNEHENVLLIIRDVRGRVEGGDYEVANIAGAAEVLAAGGRVLTLPFHAGFSSTGIIAKSAPPREGKA